MAVFSLARPPIMQNFVSCCHWTAVPAWCSVCPPSDLPPVFNPFNTFKFRLSEFARPLNIGSGNEIGLRITDGERCLIECRWKKKTCWKRVCYLIVRHLLSPSMSDFLMEVKWEREQLKKEILSKKQQISSFAHFSIVPSWEIMS